MSPYPILLMGGSGAIGQSSARALRRLHPNVEFLIAGRDPGKAKAVADELGQSEAVALDLDAGDLGLANRPVAAVAVFYSDSRLAGLRFANARGVPHLGISSGIYEIAPEIAVFMNRPQAAAVVLGYEWLVGATTIPTLELAKAFSSVERIKLGALVDENDGGGPAVAEDFERLNKMMPAALTLRDGSYVWRQGEEEKAEFHAIDGTALSASGFSSIDVAGLAAATGAKDVEFNITTAISSSRRRGGPLSTEIIIELTGVDRAGQPLRTRHAVFHPGGAAPLTALGVAMILERLAGLDNKPATLPGLYFPYQVLTPADYLAQLEQEGGGVIPLDNI